MKNAKAALAVLFVIVSLAYAVTGTAAGRDTKSKVQHSLDRASAIEATLK